MELKQFILAINQICDEKGISKERALETVEAALAAAYKKDYGKKGQIIKVDFDEETGSMKVFQIKTVVDQETLKTEQGEERPIDEEREIMIKDAEKIKKKAKVDDEIKFKLKAQDDYGRIAAQTAKQVIIQNIREAERDSIFDEYKDRIGQVASGIVQRMEPARNQEDFNNVFVDIGGQPGFYFPQNKFQAKNTKSING